VWNKPLSLFETYSVAPGGCNTRNELWTHDT